MIFSRLIVLGASTVAVGMLFLACSGSSDSNSSGIAGDDAASSNDANGSSDGKISDAGAIALSVSPSSLDFGSIVLHDAQTLGIVVTNGSSSVSLAAPTISGNGFSLDAAGFPASLAAGEHASLGVIFDPIEAGAVTGALAIATTGSSKPLDVSLSGKGIHAVDLSWTASVSDNIAGYNLYRGIVSGGPYPDKINGALIVGTSYEDTTVMTCTTYYYVATAVTTPDAGSVESGNSAEIGAAIPCD